VSIDQIHDRSSIEALLNVSMVSFVLQVADGDENVKEK
jgi:hypothetical protein